MPHASGQPVNKICHASPLCLVRVSVEVEAHSLGLAFFHSESGDSLESDYSQDLEAHRSPPVLVAGTTDELAMRSRNRRVGNPVSKSPSDLGRDGGRNRAGEQWAASS